MGVLFCGKGFGFGSVGYLMCSSVCLFGGVAVGYGCGSFDSVMDSGG
jgi:hypothetical protein